MRAAPYHTSNRTSSECDASEVVGGRSNGLLVRRVIEKAFGLLLTFLCWKVVYSFAVIGRLLGAAKQSFTAVQSSYSCHQWSMRKQAHNLSKTLKHRPTIMTDCTFLSKYQYHAVVPGLCPHKPRLFPQDFVPSNKDVICGRGKATFHHVGNRRFRVIIAMNLDKYVNSKSKVDKSLIVTSIVEQSQTSKCQWRFRQERRQPLVGGCRLTTI